MELQSVISQALTDDWSKDIQAAPKLIHIIGLCAALTTKEEILSMQLQDKRLANKGLLSNLLHLANHGQSAFQQAHSDTYKISVRAEEIGRDGGYIDRIIKNFGKANPHARKRLERALSGLENQVALSKVEGLTTETIFADWRDKTDILHEAVASERGETQKTFLERVKVEKQVERDCRLAERDKNDAKNSFDNAVVAAQRARDVAAESEKRLTDVGADATSANFGWGPGSLFKIGAFLTRGIYHGFDVYNKSRDAREAESKLESQSRMLRQLERQLFIIQNDVDAAKSETQKWKDVCEAVDVALDNLTALQYHIREMVRYFSTLSVQIGFLSERCNSEFHKFVLESESDETGEADQDDFEELLDLARQIKIFALIVHAKAKVYANVSEHELFKGFQLISCLSNRNPSLISDREYIERSAGELTVYRNSAESGIAKHVHESKLRLFAEYKKIFPTLTDDSPLNPAHQPPPAYTP
ncbi:hypothetical protein TWF132_011609 [Orbilia oligospora]|nr:hypothetical protein TWF132_011609 [Orbilia oligospora]